jgi:hypothetical protein
VSPERRKNDGQQLVLLQTILSEVAEIRKDNSSFLERISAIETKCEERHTKQPEQTKNTWLKVTAAVSAVAAMIAAGFSFWKGMK